MKKIILSLMIAMSSLVAGIVGESSDSRMMGKAYLDIFLDNGDVQYHYVKYKNNSFNLESRKLYKVFDLYRQIGAKKFKFNINTKIDLPKDIGDKVTLVIKVSKPSVYYKRINSYKGKYQTYINGDLLQPNDSRKTVSVMKDNMGNKYITIKIIVDDIYHNKYFKRAIQSISAMKFYINYQSKQITRGSASKSKEISFQVYCLEE